MDKSAGTAAESNSSELREVFFPASNKRQQLIHAASVLIIALVLCVMIVLLKAYLDGEFDSVETLQNFIEKLAPSVPCSLL